MKTLLCGEIMEGCSAKFTGETEEEVLQEAERHAVQAHGLTITPEIEEMVRAQIRDV